MEQGAERLSVLVNEAYKDARARSLAAMKQRMLQLMQGKGR
jgi:DNA-binding protein YbaB